MSGPTNDEGPAVYETSEPSKSQNTEPQKSVAIKSGDRNSQKVDLRETSLISTKQAQRIIRAIIRRFEHDLAWLLSPEAVLTASCICTLPQFGDCAGGIVAGTLVCAIALALMPKAVTRSEDLSWPDRFWELHAAVLSFGRKVLR
jgi:hypothetical protein